MENRKTVQKVLKKGGMELTSGTAILLFTQSEIRNQRWALSSHPHCGMAHKNQDKETRIMAASRLVDKEKLVCVWKRIIIWPHKMKSCHLS